MMRKTQGRLIHFGPAILEVWWTKRFVGPIEIGGRLMLYGTYNNGVEKFIKMMLKYYTIMYNLIVYTRTNFGINFGLM